MIANEGQFGARGFTEEMRQSVGTTQEGLTEFLGQFPSLFVLDGDQVILKGFGEVEGKNHLMHIPATDYAAEAVQFFVKKLEKFGPELQIKSLLVGARWQKDLSGQKEDTSYLKFESIP
uniref:Egal-1 winged helix domain-containing protein n=1 Tax=Meloidogyne incognita TaxID=6306 RepID=A0A914NPA7_MELIC